LPEQRDRTSLVYLVLSAFAGDRAEFVAVEFDAVVLESKTAFQLVFLLISNF
jgi:hypothetical protein